MGIFAFLPSLHRFFVTLYDGRNILRSTGTTFNLEHPDTGIEHLIEKMNGLQVLRGHDILVVDIEFQV